jgi:hypothetical protein
MKKNLNGKNFYNEKHHKPDNARDGYHQNDCNDERKVQAFIIENSLVLEIRHECPRAAQPEIPWSGSTGIVRFVAGWNRSRPFLAISISSVDSNGC